MRSRASRSAQPLGSVSTFPGVEVGRIWPLPFHSACIVRPNQTKLGPKTKSGLVLTAFDRAYLLSGAGREAVTELFFEWLALVS